MRYVICLVFLFGCGGSLEPTRPAPRDCPVVPSVVLDCGNATSECPDIDVPPEGCRAWNGVATIGMCVRECPPKPPEPCPLTDVDRQRGIGQADCGDGTAVCFGEAPLVDCVVYRGTDIERLCVSACP